MKKYIQISAGIGMILSSEEILSKNSPAHYNQCEFDENCSYRQICNLPEYKQTTGLQIRLNDNGPFEGDPKSFRVPIT